MSMKIIDAEWTRSVNLLIIECSCGSTVTHRSDRWNVRCPCGRTANLQQLRDEYAQASLA